MKTRSILLISLLITISGCQSNIENVPVNTLNEGALSKQALLELFIGSAVYQDNQDFVQVGFYSGDNTMKGNVWGSWLGQVDQGSWMVNENGQFCNQWLGGWSQGEDFNCYSIIPGESQDQYLMILESDNQIESASKDIRLVTITSDSADEFE